MNSGPGELDLLTPLAKGEEQGLQQAYRQDKIKEEAAREAEMKANLGLNQQKVDLEKQQFDYTKSVFESGADMRKAQLQLAQSNVVDSALNSQNIAQDHQSLLEGTGSLDKAAASGDFTSVLNMPPPAFLTPAAMQQWETHKNGLLKTGTGMAAVQNQNAILEAQRASIDSQTNQIKQISSIPNASINDYYTPGPKGQPQWNSAKAASDINNFQMNQAQKEQDIKTKGSIEEINARTKGMVDVMGIRQTGTNTRANLNDLTKEKIAANKELTELTTKNVDQTSQIFKQALQRAQAADNALKAVQPGAVIDSNSDQSNSVNSSTDWINALTGGK